MSKNRVLILSIQLEIMTNGYDRIIISLGLIHEKPIP